jgi:hypothetical protein
MFGALGHLFDDLFVGTMVALACVAIGYLVRRNHWKHREQRREYRERERQRRQFWGWE